MGSLRTSPPVACLAASAVADDQRYNHLDWRDTNSHQPHRNHLALVSDARESCYYSLLEHSLGLERGGEAALEDSQELHSDCSTTDTSLDGRGEGYSHYSLENAGDFEAVMHLLSSLLEFYFDVNLDPTLQRTESVGFIL